MGSLDSYVPLPGLSIPVVTIFDREGRIIEDEQRAVIRFMLQDGAGASVIFAAGTTGEWDRVDNPRRQQAARIAVEECRAAAARGLKVEAWAGITARTKAETIENLEHAVEIEADAAVVAPLSIGDARNPADFVIRDLGAVFERRGHAIPLFLYDNADINAPGRPPHMHTRDVKRMAEADFVRGIKVTAARAVLGNYTRAAAHFKRRNEFAIYAGNPYVAFDLFAPAGALRSAWNRYVTRDALPWGVVAGPANAMPREWRSAWEACVSRDGALIKRWAALLEAFHAATIFARDGREYQPAIACLKAALAATGVCSSEAVAPGTPNLNDEERGEFKRRFAELKQRTAEALEMRAGRPAALKAAQA